MAFSRGSKKRFFVVRRRISYQDVVSIAWGICLPGYLRSKKKETRHKKRFRSRSFPCEQQAALNDLSSGHAEDGNRSLIDELNAPFRFSFDKLLLLHILEIVMFRFAMIFR